MLLASLPSLAVPSLVLGVLSCFTAIEVASRSRSSHGLIFRLWIAGGAAAFGIGSWSTHLLASLAPFSPPEIGVEPILALASLALALLGGLGMLLTLSSPTRTPLQLLGGCLFTGMAFCLMHNLAFEAIGLDASNQGPFALNSIVIVLGGMSSTGALYAACRLNLDDDPRAMQRRLALSVIVGTLGVMTLMGSIDASPGRQLLIDPDDLVVSSPWFSTTLVIISGLGLAMTLMMVAFDLTMQARAGRLIVGMQQVNAELEELFARRTRELELLYDRAPCGYHSVDENGLFLQMNQTELDWLGYTREEVVGKMHLSDLHTEVNRARLDTNFAVVAQAGEICHATYDYVRKDGSTFPVSIHAGAVRDDDGKFVACLTSVNDETENRKITAELERKTREANAANLAKSAFLASMSHEIRTPMNGVLGMLEMLQQSELDIEQLELVGTARESGATLLALIDEILDFSKIEAGKLDLDLNAESLSGVIESAGDALASIAARNDVELLLYCDPTLPSRVHTDANRLRQIMMNLGGNAVKFAKPPGGERGKVTIRADRIDVDDHASAGSRARVRLEVRDNGIGMSESTIQSLFRPFVQGESSTTRRFGGTGLGLSISQRIAEAMHGEIRIDSSIGAGSTFSLELEFDIARSHDTPETLTDLHGLSVIVSSGCPDKCEILSHYLASAGAAVTVLNDNETTIGHIRNLPPSVERLIIVAPDEDGAYSRAHLLKRQLGQDGEARALRFVSLARSRHQRSQLIAHDTVAIEANAMRRAALLRAVAIAAGRLSPEVEHERQASRANCAATVTSIEQAEADGRLILVAEDNETNRKVIGRQLHMLGYAADMADDGRQALERWPTRRYGLLLTDCHMPELDGFQLTAGVRQIEAISGRRVPIVAITANAMKGEADECIRAGMDDFLTKPTQLDRLAATLSKWLPSASSNPQPPEIPAPPMSTAAPTPAQAVAPQATALAVDANALPLAIGSDEVSLISEFYDVFLRGTEQTLADMASSHTTGDLKELSGLAHKLKSSAATIGAEALAGCCIALEQAAHSGDTRQTDHAYQALVASFAPVRSWLLDWAAAHIEQPAKA